MENSTVVNALRLTAEIYGKNLSEAGATMFANDLARFSSTQILDALRHCRTELKFFPSVAEISSRIPDGRPGVEEAWAMIPKDEYGSVVWSDEMAEAYGPARSLLQEGDLIAARMTFKEVYSKLISEARNSGKAPTWSPSFGFEPQGRITAMREAVKLGRIDLKTAQIQLGAMHLDQNLLLADKSNQGRIKQIIHDSLKNPDDKPELDK